MIWLRYSGLLVALLIHCVAQQYLIATYQTISIFYQFYFQLLVNVIAFRAVCPFILNKQQDKNLAIIVIYAIAIELLYLLENVFYW